MLNKRRKTDVCGRNIDVIDLSSIFKTEFEIILFTSMKKNKSDCSSPRLYFTISGTKVPFHVKVAKDSE